MLSLLRPRKVSERVTGSLIRIRLGEFGGVADIDPSGPDGIYHYHVAEHGYGFGTGVDIFEPNFELPVQTIWGAGAVGGFLYKPNAWPVTSRVAGARNGDPALFLAVPTVKTSGIGGLQAGGIVFQPLLTNEQGGG